MSGDDHRRRGGIPPWVWGVGALFVLLLGANLALTVYGDRISGVISSERLAAAAFWGACVTAAGACLLGWRWAGQALERSDRSSTRQFRTSFIFALCVVVLLPIATFEDALDPMQFAAVVAATMVLLIVPFALSARTLSERGQRRRRRRRSDDGGDA